MITVDNRLCLCFLSIKILRNWIVKKARDISTKMSVKSYRKKRFDRKSYCELYFSFWVALHNVIHIFGRSFWRQRFSKRKTASLFPLSRFKANWINLNEIVEIYHRRLYKLTMKILKVTNSFNSCESMTIGVNYSKQQKRSFHPFRIWTFLNFWGNFYFPIAHKEMFSCSSFTSKKPFLLCFRHFKDLLKKLHFCQRTRKVSFFGKFRRVCAHLSLLLTCAHLISFVN